MSDKFQQRHDRYVEALYSQLKESQTYDILGKFLEYSNDMHSLGELDLYGIDLKNSLLDIYEIKGADESRLRRKGKKQLLRAREYFLPGFKQIRCFLCLPDSIQEIF